MKATMLQNNRADWLQIHPLLQDDEQSDSGGAGDGPDDIRLKSASTRDVTALDAPDAELAPILDQLRRSLENIQGNHEQLGGIGESIRDAQAALDDILFRHNSGHYVVNY